jgi:hypothetical protein
VRGLPWRLRLSLRGVLLRFQAGVALRALLVRRLLLAALVADNALTGPFSLVRLSLCG